MPRLKLRKSEDANEHDKMQQTISKFFSPSVSASNKNSGKRELTKEQEDKHVPSKKFCTSLGASSHPGQSTSDKTAREIGLSKSASLKLQTFSSQNLDWTHFGVDGNQDLIRLSNCSAHFTVKNNKGTEQASDLCTKQTIDTSVQSQLARPSTSINRGSSTLEDRKVEKITSLATFTRTSPGKQEPVQDSSESTTPPGKKAKYTPLELQVVELKKENPGVILFIECGYKYRFFGHDAEIAAKELNIFCHLDRNFMTASIPRHRLHVHLSRLVAKGYKVGVVKQTETAALKAAGDNRGAPFTRKLAAVYTKATLIGPDVEPSGEDKNDSTAASGHLMCIWESTPEGAAKTSCVLAFVSAQLSTGEIIYDVFEDNSSRLELASRLSHIEPAEVLLPQGVSDFTRKTVKHYAALVANADDTVRTELINRDWYDEAKASDNVRHWYREVGATSQCVTAVSQLPVPVLSALHALLKYLTDFNLQKVLKVNSLFEKFSGESQHVLLGGKTLSNLEVLVNSLDGKTDGSLYWLLNHTSTKFGARLLKRWLTKPLYQKHQINERLDAVQCIVEEKCPDLHKIKEVFHKLPDLEKTLALIFHGKCSPGEFLVFCQSLLKIYTVLEKSKASFNRDLKSSLLLQNSLAELLELLGGIKPWIDSIDAEQARKGNDKSSLFKHEENFPKLKAHKEAIKGIIDELQNHKREVRKLLRIPALEYVTVLGTEFLVEVKNTNLQLVPEDWRKISSTKAVSRFHSPFIINAVKRLSQLREQLVIDSNEAWDNFLRSFEDEYAHYRKAVGHLAVLDCLFSLAHVGKQHGYCRPEISDSSSFIHIERGRHPIIDVLKAEQDQFVPNDTHLEATAERCMIITGPNMGGKSSYIKQVALITLMAHTGSFVPAESASIGIVDAIYTRMGASDDLFQGRSTFMVELQEASEVIAKATHRSLVILDELGRGTSTHDGVAIAYATLKYFVEQVKCLTMFVTHYPPVTELENSFPGIVQNYHMSFYVQEEDEGNTSDGIESLAFLYQLVEGVAQCSYGLNVARLADIPLSVLQMAKSKATYMQKQVTDRRDKRGVFAKLMTSDQLIDFSKQQELLNKESS